MTAAHALIAAFMTYITCGLVFAVLFITRWMASLDPASVGAGIGFRLMIVPGTVALWPALLLKWLRRRRRP